MNKKGRIYVGEYYMECWIVGADNSLYLRGERFMRTDFKLYTDKPEWKKESLIELIPTNVDISNYGNDFPWEFPFDLLPSGISHNTISNGSIFPSTFAMTFYGPAENPQLVIGGHTYRVNCTLQEGERIVVESTSKTIKKYGIDGSVQNYFNYRYKPESVFDAIPAGTSELTWNGEYKADINLIDTRSEPRWTWTDVKIEEIADVVEIDDRIYLLDSDGDFILDSDGDRISTTVAEVSS